MDWCRCVREATSASYFELAILKRDMAWIGLDIGGANLKAAFPHLPDCPAMEMPFPMWTDWQKLDQAITKLVGRADSTDSIAVTMTGELADNFESRRAGVCYIADAVERVFQGRRIAYYACDGVWRSRSKLEQNWDLVAAANWHATATWGSRLLPDQTGVVIDVGSTTTDVSLMRSGSVASGSRNDLQRLSTGELLYVGADRTPVCGLLTHVQYGQQRISLANELFATVGDAAIWKGLAPEFPDLTQTADRRPKTRLASGQRMARMLCRDLDDLEPALVDAMADQTIAAATAAIAEAISQQLTTANAQVSHALVLGEGQFLACEALKSLDSNLEVVLLGDEVGEMASVCGPAHAVAVLASEDLG